MNHEELSSNFTAVPVDVENITEESDEERRSLRSSDGVLVVSESKKRSAKSLGLVALTFLVGLIACLPVNCLSANFRILTYNTAFLYAKAEAPGPVPPPYCSTCDPFEMPVLPCLCSELTVWPNHERFANLTESWRAQKIADRIVATDQDVVVLNEAFHPDARAVFMQTLGVDGPYKHFITLLRGHAPVEGLTLGDLIQMKAGEISRFLEDLLVDLPAFLDFDAVSADSGLMIFSKYPFLKLEGSSVQNDAICPDSECTFYGWNNGAVIQPGFLAFKIYDACEAEDCWASKGVGFVKIATPGIPRYVAFTHMQADYPDQGDIFPGTRAKQFAEIRDLIVGAIPSNEIADAAIYLTGDLNVAGASRTSAQTPKTQEWHDVFDPASNNPNVAGGFFACGNGLNPGSNADLCRFGANSRSRALTDSWGFETSPTDRGISNETDGARLDFIVHSSSGGRPCMQHAMIAYDLQADPDGNGGLTWLSDHLPVRVDFNTMAKFCSPNNDPNAAMPSRNVHEFQFGPTNCSTSPQSPPCHQNEIVAPPVAQLGPAGAFQWFMIDEAGTYSINLDSAVAGENVAFMVYHHTDLSRPITPFEEQEGEFGIIYSMPEPPYYIRTFAIDANSQPDRLAKARKYTLKVHQHLCRSPMDACVLDPGLALHAPYTYVWPMSVDLLSDLRELWWRFKTSGVRDGKLKAGKDFGVRFPTVRMQFESTSSDPYTCLTKVVPVIQQWNSGLFPTQLMKTIDFVDTQIDNDHDWEDDGNRDDLRVAPDLPGHKDDKFDVYFLKVTRDSNWMDGFNPCNAGITTWVSYHTNLTYIVPRELKMWSELDDDLGAEDNLRLSMGFDAGDFSIPPPNASVKTSLEEPDSGSTFVSLHGYASLKGYYVDRVWPNIWETDEAEFIKPWSSFYGIETLTSWSVSTPSKGSSDVPWVLFSDGPNGDEADYYYYFLYKVCHLATEPACTNP